MVVVIQKRDGTEARYAGVQNVSVCERYTLRFWPWRRKEPVTLKAEEWVAFSIDQEETGHAPVL